MWNQQYIFSINWWTAKRGSLKYSWDWLGVCSRWVISVQEKGNELTWESENIKAKNSRIDYEKGIGIWEDGAAKGQLSKDPWIEKPEYYLAIKIQRTVWET